MNPTELTPAELRDELDRIDRMQGPLTAATMMRRNMVQDELCDREWLANASPNDIARDRIQAGMSNAEIRLANGDPEPPRPLIDPTKVAAARTQLAALRGVGQ